MKTLVKFELKKILKNRLFIGIFILALIGMLAFTLSSVNQYKLGNYGSHTISDMGGEKLPEIFVSKANIDELRQSLTQFENRDEIYEALDSSKEKAGDRIYFGKNGADMNLLMWKLNKGEITEEEMQSILQNANTSLKIKKEYLPEYFKLYEPVKRYESTLINVERHELEAKEQESEYDKLLYLKYAQLAKESINNGFTVGYDYGWANIFSALSEQTGILLVLVIIFGLCNVFTGEYSNSTDALLLSTKNGRGKVVGAKIIASIIYCFMCFCAYLLMAVTINFAFLGADGANVGFNSSNVERFFEIVPAIFLGCVLIGFITLAISAFLTKQVTSAAVSLIVCIVPLGISIFTYTSNIYFSQTVAAMPVNMVFGTYILTDYFAYWNNELIDLKVLFIPVAVIVTAICIPVIYTAYCRHQVKN
ncbi:MAG TPA: ABC transporter permease subunit [Oscillospiraceae bacterium]|nr:ABC transporter permease subunit [Oscillospiraceae bacterium]